VLDGPRECKKNHQAANDLGDHVAPTENEPARRVVAPSTAAISLATDGFSATTAMLIPCPLPHPTPFYRAGLTVQARGG
jgi:hypothetical protein